MGEDILELADKAVAWALDALGGYTCEECDAGIHYMQARGLDRWSMQAQMDHPECFGCNGTERQADGEPCPICQSDLPTDSAEAERAAIVTWLREEVVRLAPKAAIAAHIRQLLATAIEAREHHGTQGKE